MDVDRIRGRGWLCVSPLTHVFTGQHRMCLGSTMGPISPTPSHGSDGFNPVARGPRTRPPVHPRPSGGRVPLAPERWSPVAMTSHHWPILKHRAAFSLATLAIIIPRCAAALPPRPRPLSRRDPLPQLATSPRLPPDIATHNNPHSDAETTKPPHALACRGSRVV